MTCPSSVSDRIARYPASINVQVEFVVLFARWGFGMVLRFLRVRGKMNRGRTRRFADSEKIQAAPRMQFVR